MADVVDRDALDPSAAALLLDIAADSIEAGLGGSGPRLPGHELPAALHRRVGSFVTLHVAGELNGCIGSIEGVDPLGADVARHAWSAAFDDPRLPALRRDDLPMLETEISILSPLRAVAAGSRVELLAALRPGVDGLLVEAGVRRAVFLPAVWRTLPEPDRFLAQLLVKADIDADPWPADLAAWVFTAEEIHR